MGCGGACRDADACVGEPLGEELLEFLPADDLVDAFAGGVKLLFAGGFALAAFGPFAVFLGVSALLDADDGGALIGVAKAGEFAGEGEQFFALFGAVLGLGHGFAEQTTEGTTRRELTASSMGWPAVASARSSTCSRIWAAHSRDS